MHRRIALAALLFSFQSAGQEIEPWVRIYHPAESLGPPAEELAQGSRIEVRFGGGGVTCPAPGAIRLRARQAGATEWMDAALADFSCTRIAALLPSELLTGPAVVAITIDGVEFARAPLQIVRSRFGILQPDRIPFTAPLRAGSSFTVAGAGLGAADFSEIHGELDGQPLEFLEAERSAAGVEFLRFRLTAETIATSCYTPLALRVAGRWTGVFPIAVNVAGGPCRHPLRLSQDQLATLDSGGMVANGGLTFTSNGPGIGRFSAGFSASARGLFQVLSFSEIEEGCRQFPSLSIRPLGPSRPMDAGEITVTTPSGAVVQANTPAALDSGDYIVKVSGGSEVMPVDVPVTLPRVPAVPPQLPRAANREVTVEWDASAYQPGDVVTLSLPAPNGATLEVCKANASQGSIRVPIEQDEADIWIGVARRRDTPLLFPYRLRSGEQVWGLVDYWIQRGYSVKFIDSTKTGH
ncbi:MAG: hypothetical protein JNK48_34150 [Bryobacterales bacterium]|nr:hypothetical protein [Bryobacterales bacterium]